VRVNFEIFWKLMFDVVVGESRERVGRERRA
jgi:hypothetical protein